MCMFVFCVLCLTVLVNCLLNALAICVGEVNVLSFESYCVVLCCVVFLLLIRGLSSKEYVCCVCDTSVCLSVPP